MLAGCDREESRTTTTDAAVKQTALLLATSETHSCALRNTGLYCWGANFAGQLGDIGTQDSALPVLAHFAGPDIVQLALATGRTCVLRGDGTVTCWGSNERGQIGDGTHAASYTPMAALGIDDATALAIDDGSTCVLRAGDAGVACWGNAPAEAPAEGSVVPVPVAGVTGAVELRVGSQGTYCAREPAGTVKCWRFEAGQWTAASEVPELAGARAIAMTFSNTVCALAPSSEIKCHSFDTQLTETMLDSQGSVAIASTGGLTVCGGDAAQAWRCWLSVPSLDLTVLKVNSNVSIVEVVMMGLRVCALRQDTTVACLSSEQFTVVPTTDFPDLLPVPLPQ